MVTSHGTGTGRRAATVKGVKVAGKTGTAQWGPVRKRRNAAWFAGFAPADNPLYAFAAVVEGNVGETIAGGANAAPVIGQLLADLLKGYKPPAAEKPEDSAETAEVEPPSAESDAVQAEEAPPADASEFTEDLMNPEGGPLTEESVTTE